MSAVADFSSTSQIARLSCGAVSMSTVSLTDKTTRWSLQLSRIWKPWCCAEAAEAAASPE